MKKSLSAGFTIIEVILFLAISGILAAGILASATVSINQQKYRDAANSLANIVQAEFSQVFNVANDPLDAGTKCDSVNNFQTGTSTIAFRGQSDCSIIGRLITIDSDGKHITSQTVLATQSITGSMVGKTEKQALQEAKLVTASTGSLSYELEWGTHINDEMPNQANTKQFTLLIVRSPSTGFVSVYSSNKANESIENILNNGTVSQTYTLCVNADGLTGGPQSGVKILAGASSASAVHLISGSPCGNN